MNEAQASPAAPPKLSILLMDSNVERRGLRTKMLLLRGAEVIAATDLTEASSMWHRDRYDLVLMDIRKDHYGCLAWRDEIKKDNPKQVVAFLVGPPRFIDLEPLRDSYVSEEHGTEWGRSLREAVREACGSLPQRNGFVEVGYRIAAARKLSGLPPREVHALAPAAEAQKTAIDVGGQEQELLAAAATQPADGIETNSLKMETA